MDKYLINKNELLAFLRYEILYKWKCVAETNDKAKNFSYYFLIIYILNDTRLNKIVSYL